MKYIYVGGQVIPKHCIYGPRPAEGIVLDNIEWCSIVDHLVKEQREKEFAAVLRAKENAKKDISFQMTKTWNNTLASIKTLGEQRRLEKAEKDKQDKIDQYNEIIRRRKEEKKKIFDDVKKIFYEDTETSRIVNSSVLYSLVLQERQKQLDFKKALNEEREKKEKEEHEKMLKDVEAFYKEEMEEKMANKSINNKYWREVTEQVKERKLKRETAEKEEAELERQDVKNMMIEGEKIAYCNQVEKKYRKEFAAQYTKKGEAQLDHERNLEMEEEEEDGLNKIYLQYTQQFYRQRKRKEAQIMNDRIDERIKISEKLAELLTTKAIDPEESQKQVAIEIENEFLAEEAKKEEKRLKVIEEIKNSKKLCDEKAIKENYHALQKKKWEVLQACRSREIDKEKKKKKEKEILEGKISLKAYLDLQVKEREERRAEELKELNEPLNDIKSENEAIKQYCKEGIDFVKKYDTPLYPVLASVAKIMKTNRIEDQEKEQETNAEEVSRKRQNRTPKGCFCFKC